MHWWTQAKQLSKTVYKTSAENTIHWKSIFCNKDTSVLNDDISGGLVEGHLVEDVDDLTHKFIVFLLGWKQQHKQMKNITSTSLNKIFCFIWRRHNPFLITRISARQHWAEMQYGKTNKHAHSRAAAQAFPIQWCLFMRADVQNLLQWIMFMYEGSREKPPFGESINFSSEMIQKAPMENCVVVTAPS